MTATDSRTGDAVAPSVVRALIRRIVDGVAVGQKYHLKLVFFEFLESYFDVRAGTFVDQNGDEEHGAVG